DLDDHGAALGVPQSIANPLNSRGSFSDGADDRLTVPLGPALEGAFRTPSLRCAARRPSFMHTGQLRTLADVVAFFNRGGDMFGYPGAREIAPLGLTDRERADLVAFLQALNGPGPAPELLVAPP